MNKLAVLSCVFGTWALSGPTGFSLAMRAHARHWYSEKPWTLRSDIDFFRLNSQGNQDGVLAYIFENIGVTNKYYVEFGFNSRTFDGGSGANTYVLHKHFGWKGLLMDGGNENEAINLHKEFMVPENIASIFRKHNIPEEPDFVSIDIDSFDIWLFKALVTGGFRPRVLTIEYNCNFPLGVSITCEPDSQTNVIDRAFGSSLSAVDEVAREHGYSVVQVVCGLDAVLVRDDVLKGEPALPLSHFKNCTGMSVHAPATPESKSKLMDYRLWRSTDDVGEARKAAQKWMQENPTVI